MTEQKIQGIESTLTLDPPVPFTPAQATRLIVEVDPVHPYNTLVRVQQDGEWRPVGCISVFQLYVDALGALNVEARFASKPLGVSDEAWEKILANIDKAKKLLQDVGVTVV